MSFGIADKSEHLRFDICSRLVIQVPVLTLKEHTEWSVGRE